jgi:hypothetical protein
LESQSTFDQESARYALEWVAVRRCAPEASRRLGDLFAPSVEE